MIGLPPMTTMVTPFAFVVDYRTYRLYNNKGTLGAEEAMDIYRIQQGIDGLHPTLAAFSGSPAIELLTFLAKMKDALDTKGASEAAGMRVIAYYLDEESQDVHEEQLSSVVKDQLEEVFETRTACTLSHIVDSFLRRVLTDQVLQGAHNAVTRGSQRDNEDEAQFATRISKSSRLCRHVFRKSDVVNYYFCGLRPSVRKMVAQKVRLLPVNERTNLASLKQPVLAIGTLQRAMRQEEAPVEKR